MARQFIGLLLWCGLALAVGAAPVRVGVTIPPHPANAETVKEMDAAKALGLGEVKLRADWPRIQPTATLWNFEWLDALVAEARARRLHVTLVFGLAPRWAVSYLDHPTDVEIHRAKPDLPAFKKYVAAVVKRYKTEVDYQAWERPSSQTLLAVPRDVRSLFYLAAMTAHETNPAARVIIPEPGDVDLSWIADYAANARLNAHADAYLLAPGRALRTPSQLWWRLQTLRARVLPAKDTPALLMEFPVAGEDDAWAPLCAAALLQEVAEVQLLPVDNTAGCPTANPRQAGLLRAVAELQNYSYAGWCPLASGVPCGVFRHEDQSLALALPQAKASMALTAANAPGHQVELTMLDGTPKRCAVPGAMLELPDAPALITGLQLTPQPGTPKAKFMPVKGDTVSLDPDGKDTSAIWPLHNLPGGQYLSVTDGGVTELQTVRPAAPFIHFDVPDGFLFYNVEKTPIEVTIKVRGASNTNRAGYYLYYDAVGGMNNTPWQWIDRSPDQTFSYTVRLNDAIFAGREGYDFRITAAGSRETVRVVGVTVKKLAK